jgi:anti-sigma-K factor RskA
LPECTGNMRQITACIASRRLWAYSAAFSSSLPCSTVRFRVWRRLPFPRAAPTSQPRTPGGLWPSRSGKHRRRTIEAFHRY